MRRISKMLMLFIGVHAYISELFVALTSGRSRLLLAINLMLMTYGARAFSCSGQGVRNSLPGYLSDYIARCFNLYIISHSCLLVINLCDAVARWGPCDFCALQAFLLLHHVGYFQYSRLTRRLLYLPSFVR